MKWYRKEISGALLLALVLVLGGLICGVYFLAFFDTSVQVPVDVIMGQAVGGFRVNNIGLMQEKQNGIYLGFGTAAVGLILRAFAGRRKEGDEA